VQIAILAGGLATRLGELASSRPKCMLLVHGKPFLEYQIEFLKTGGVKDIVLCIGHMRDQIMRHFGDGSKYGVNIQYSYEHRPLGTAGALKNAAALLDEVFYTIYGDSYLFLDFASAMRYFLSQNKLALMTVYRNENRYDRSNTAIAGNLVTKYAKQDRTQDMVYIDYGANIFRTEVLKMVPENQFYSLEELFPRLIVQGQLLAFEVKQRFYEIGSPQGIKDFVEYISSAG
jgi:MurNAc alpha-1-phosphate uridylyltransferase